MAARRKRAAPKRAPRTEPDSDMVRGEMRVMPINFVQPNPWNPNEMDDATYEALKHGLKTDGWLASHALLVWGEDDQGDTQNYIIDGEHRWKAANELGIEKGPMVILDGITEAEAKELTLKLLRKRGQAKPEPLGALLQELVPQIGADLVSLELGFTSAELDSFTLDSSTFDGLKRMDLSEAAAALGDPPEEATDTGSKPVRKKKNPNWFYIEFYEDDDTFQRLQEILEPYMRTEHEIEGAAFAEMVDLYAKKARSNKAGSS